MIILPSTKYIWDILQKYVPSKELWIFLGHDGVGGEIFRRNYNHSMIFNQLTCIECFVERIACYEMKALELSFRLLKSIHIY